MPKVIFYGGGPYIKGSCDTPANAINVYVQGSHAYMADGESGLQVIDITNPNNPSIAGSCGPSPNDALWPEAASPTATEKIFRLFF